MRSKVFGMEWNPKFFSGKILKLPLGEHQVPIKQKEIHTGRYTHTLVSGSFLIRGVKKELATIFDVETPVRAIDGHYTVIYNY